MMMGRFNSNRQEFQDIKEIDHYQEKSKRREPMSL